MAECLFVGIGGFIGSVCRYLIRGGSWAAAAAYMLLSLILGVAAVFAAEALMHM